MRITEPEKRMAIQRGSGSGTIRMDQKEFDGLHVYPGAEVTLDGEKFIAYGNANGPEYVFMHDNVVYYVIIEK